MEWAGTAQADARWHRFREAAARWGLPEPKSNRCDAALQLVEQFIGSIWCDACRFAHAETVRMDSTLVRLFGRFDMPMGW